MHSESVTPFRPPARGRRVLIRSRIGGGKGLRGSPLRSRRGTDASGSPHFCPREPPVSTIAEGGGGGKKFSRQSDGRAERTGRGERPGLSRRGVVGPRLSLARNDPPRGRGPVGTFRCCSDLCLPLPRSQPPLKILMTALRRSRQIRSGVLPVTATRLTVRNPRPDRTRQNLHPTSSAASMSDSSSPT